MRRLIALFAVLAIAVGANAAAGADPGITDETILLGGTVPLASVARGASAYFEYVNARGGVHGRTITYKPVEDGSDPSLALAATRELVEQDEVLAIFDPLGTDRDPAARAYLGMRKVPQLFAAGFRPGDEAEGWIYGAYVARTRPDARIGVLYRNDVGGQELLAGLMRGLATARSKVVVTAAYEPTAAEVQTQLAELRASGANVLALFAAPRIARQAYGYARRVGWRPQVFVSTSAADGAAAVEGAISIASVKAPADPRWRDDAAIRLYRSIMARYARGASAEVLDVYGMAAAYQAVQVLKAAGEAPTRASVTAQSRRLRDAANPFLLPGITVATSGTDRFPVEQAQLRRWSKGRWRSFGGLWRI